MGGGIVMRSCAVLLSPTHDTLCWRGSLDLRLPRIRMPGKGYCLSGNRRWSGNEASRLVDHPVPASLVVGGVCSQWHFLKGAFFAFSVFFLSWVMLHFLISWTRTFSSKINLSGSFKEGEMMDFYWVFGSSRENWGTPRWACVLLELDLCYHPFLKSLFSTPFTC